ncbi:MAG: electron transfer flavoprotein subunit beta, partial [Elusimicrobiota bacterium]
RELADCLGVRVGVVVPGKEVEGMSPALIAAGADEIHCVQSPGLESFDPVVYRKAVGDVIAKHWPQIVLFAATPQGRVLAPMISYRLGCGLTADCTGLEIRDHSRRGEVAILAQTRPALGGNVMATICTMGSKSQMATARPGVMRRLPPDPAR